MISIDFTNTEQATLFEVYHNHPNKKSRTYAHALYLKSLGLKHGLICKVLQIAPSTLITIFKKYQKCGISAVLHFKYQGQVSDLNAYAELILEDFDKTPPHNIKEARTRIYELTGILRSPTAIRDFAHRFDLKYLKTGSIPGGQKGNSEKKKQEREQWRKQELEPRLAEAKNGERIILFVDAAHFIYSAFAGYVWCLCRIFLAAPAGRKRYNVLGAVEAISKEVITFCNEDYINAKSVCKLMKKIYLHYQQKQLPITLILDNARYQKCKLVRRYAKVLGIELLYLPAYSPQLNLIERLWKYVKRTCLYARYYDSFDKFKQAIDDCISKSKVAQNPEIESLLTLNFQSFNDVKIAA